ncbi:riboflavin biosynthesis protein RibD [Arcobacter sp. 31_11_sub10_T18]|nr:riboflavin biosynthesis protein RibD [Arcobacter sp. 31_11_sub10_T18]
MKINDDFFMKLAINEAWKYQLLTYPNPAVGAVVVKKGEILSVEAHKKAGEAHAEVNALKTAYLNKNPESRLKMMKTSFEIHEYLIKNSDSFFEDCTIYVTLEPCNHIGKTPSCAQLLQSINIGKVIVGTNDLNKVASGGIELLTSSNIDIKSNVMKKECDELLFPFIKWQQGTFIFYKMAQTLNGTIDGGYISSNQTLAYVHTLRDKIDLLTIGGNTVRIDKPTLDSRFILGKNPDVLIYSKNKIFDKSIPLFSVPNRDVMISDDLFKLLNYKFVMIEGSYNLLEILSDKIDYLVLLVSPKMKMGLNITSTIELNFEIIHENYIGKEKIIFLRKIN